MSSEFDEEIREFLIESNENLALLDQQIVQLEQQPENQELISSVFRTIHSVKGTCGFFGFDILGSVTHVTESILGQLRERKRTLTPELITLILEAVDAVKLLLQRIESTGSEGDDETEWLREKLEIAYRSCGTPTTIQGMLQAIAGVVPPDEAAADPQVQDPKVPAPLDVELQEQANTPADSPAPALLAKVPAQPAATSAPAADPPAAMALAPALPDPAPVVVATSAPAEPAPPGDISLSDSTIRVDVNLLNRLMNLVGELVLTRNQLLQSAGNFSSGVQQTSQRLNIITTELQASVMKTRMQPIGTVWSKLPRVVRDLSAKCGKQIDLEMLGAETELDRSLVEAIRDPLTHIVRNSCDHGIEMPGERVAKGKPAMGKLSMRAFHESGAVNIEITDDGAGIDPERVRTKAVEKNLITAEYARTLSPAEAINLIFLPGFSTAAQVTSISGRGVGMDVVKTNIEKISGSVQIVCPPEGGTCLRIKIPLTLAIIPGLVVASGDALQPHGEQGDRFVIPQSHLVEMTRVDLSSAGCPVDRVGDALIFRHRGKLLPLVYLSALLSATAPPTRQDFVNVIILQVLGRQFALVVDRICDTQEIVVKPLGRQLKHLSCYGGATIMGDGRPALILDVGGIAKLAELDVQHKDNVQNKPGVQDRTPTAEFILFDAGGNRRMALPLTIVNRLEELAVESVEYAGGSPVARYRGELLPLVAAASVTGGVAPTLQGRSNIHVIVINNGLQHFGLHVEKIYDIVQESLTAVRCSSSPGLLGSAVIGGQVTDIVDAMALCQSLGSSWSRTEAKNCVFRIGFYHGWPLAAEMLQTMLDAAGYRAVRFDSAAQLKDVLRQGEIDALVVNLDGTAQQPEWLTQARSDTGALAKVPAVEMADPAIVASQAADRAISWSGIRVDRNDRVLVLQSISALLSTQSVGKAA